MIEAKSRTDKKAIKKAIEEVFERYRIYKYLMFDNREARTTTSYEPRFHGNTNLTSDQTGEIASWNVDEHERRRRYCEWIEHLVSRLPSIERFLIQERYLCQDAQYITDINVYSYKFDPPISEGTYAKIRWRAFTKLAAMLGIIDNK